MSKKRYYLPVGWPEKELVEGSAITLSAVPKPTNLLAISMILSRDRQGRSVNLTIYLVSRFGMLGVLPQSL